MKAIDVHAHFGTYDRGPGGLLDRMMSGGIDVVRSRARDVDVRLTVVSAIRALMPYGGDVFRGNEDAVAAAEAHPDIRFWAVLDPRIRESYDQVAPLLDHPGCAGIKIHPREPLESAGTFRISADDLGDVCELAGRMGRPIRRMSSFP